MIAGAPAVRREVFLTDLDRLAQAVVPAVEEAEHRYDRGDLHDLRLAPVPAHLRKGLVGHAIGLRGCGDGEVERDPFGRAIEGTHAKVPDRLDLPGIDPEEQGTARGVR